MIQNKKYKIENTTLKTSKKASNKKFDTSLIILYIKFNIKMKKASMGKTIM